MSNLTVLTKELIPVYENVDGNKLVNARELHEWLGNKDNFTTWIGDRIKQYGFIENVDYTSFLENSKKPQGGRPSKEYVITLNMAKELSMIERTEKGKQARKYFIKCEEKLKEVVKDPYKGLSKELQAVFILDKKYQEQDTRITRLENKMTIDYSQQEELNSLAKRVVIQALGGKDTPAYKELNKKAFSTLWRDYKRIMQINSYKNTAVKDFIKAKELLNSWKPNRELELMIKGANSQVRF
ncbi:antirepressor [Clostridium tetani]|uniref:ORF6C domain-containing protein n=1 Tax=Clostridium tetani TaxID=1513 RepID=UPI0029536D16|nr:antA/AntB antirepressor family protein [Clostridium tetani]BDR73377.1 antirepressor [Clostridium tetani]